MQNTIKPLSIGKVRKIIKTLDDTDTTFAKDFSPESVSVSHIKSVIIATPVTFNNKLICSVSMLKTENIDKILEINPLISSKSKTKINITVQMRKRNTYSGLYDLISDEKHK